MTHDKKIHFTKISPVFTVNTYQISFGSDMEDKEYVVSIGDNRRIEYIKDLVVPMKIANDIRISGNEKMLMATLLQFKEENQESPSNEELASLVGLSPRAIARSLSNLETCGYVKRKAVYIRNRRIVLQ